MTRITIYLDDTLLSRVYRYVPASSLSRLVNQLLAERIAQFEHTEIETQMRQGYLATCQERQELSNDWQAVDSEGWPA